ncbi:MAG TPA: NAD(P)H-dependent oxidoreductase [Sphingopyxis sp.]|uniref:NADPH-dependent FMN reductase n=1 Tax=Sphingopyxis sp. TaxID=1908224 RepID=UPI002C2DC628|nr:NAD(P)H-dependent oxidoreductase [Sphingopyxis sp.]HWW55853.1 NAD(P)H-dependent oxidoreductase [Sphingopyxis sp.]
MTSPAFILGIGGTTRPDSSSERILRAALARIEAHGVATECLAGPDLMLPLYAPGQSARDPRAETLVARMRGCAGVVIASPGYHGTISGLIKNALDYAEDLAADARPYFDGKPVGCIACAYGWQAAGSTLATLRTISHALRGWPTPLGVTINSSLAASASGDDASMQAEASLDILARQMIERLG